MNVKLHILKGGGRGLDKNLLRNIHPCAMDYRFQIYIHEIFLSRLPEGAKPRSGGSGQPGLNQWCRVADPDPCN